MKRIISALTRSRSKRAGIKKRIGAYTKKPRLPKFEFKIPKQNKSIKFEARRVTNILFVFFILLYGRLQSAGTNRVTSEILLILKGR